MFVKSRPGEDVCVGQLRLFDCAARVASCGVVRGGLLDNPLRSAMAKRTPKKGALRTLVDAFFGTGQVIVPREAKHVRFVTLGGYFAAGQMT